MQSQVGGGGGGYLIESWVGRCGLAAQTLTLFKTRISDFPTLLKTECQFLIPCLRHLLWHNQTEIKRGVNSYMLILIKTLVHLKIPCLKQTGVKEIPHSRQKILKTIPCRAAPPRYALIMEYPPPPPGYAV